LFLLIWLFSGDLKLSGALFIGGLAVSLIILTLGRLFISSGRSLGSHAGQALHLALANLKRRAGQNSVQLVSFTLAIKLLLLILVVRTDLIDEWQAQLPENAPNRFLVNVTKAQVNSVEQFYRQHNLKASDLYPIVRGRLVKVNSEHIAKEVSKETPQASERGRQGPGRELSLTWRSNLPAKNQVIAGQFWGENNDSAQVSVESQIAERLNIGLGDELIFQIGAQQFSVEVTSIREVNWQSMQPNFYMIFSPAVLQDFPATYISSVHLEASQKGAFNQFIQQYPTISVINVDAMIDQLRSVIAQVSVAIEFILVLVVLAGTLVLIAQVQASMEERERELAILRTLGASGRLLKNSVLMEFVVLGAIAGLMAGMAMELAVYLLQTRIFEMEPSWHFPYWGLAVAAGGVFVGVSGLAACWRLLNLSSVTLIRRTL
jgi:putative ABC transport system permease protein